MTKDNMTEGYKRNCSDELAWKEIDQLHEATLQMSKQCFEYKKLCVGFLVAACALLVKLSGDDIQLSFGFFAVGFVIAMGFLIADANAYYYQRKVRGRMADKMNLIARNNNSAEVAKPIDTSWRQALFNSSMVLYYVLLVPTFIGGLSFICECSK